jgi:hypothetical protein
MFKGIILLYYLLAFEGKKKSVIGTGELGPPSVGGAIVSTAHKLQLLHE